MIKSSSIFHLMLLLVAVYSAQGGLYPSGSIISRAALLILLAISAIYFIKTMFQQNNKNMFYKAVTLFLLINICGAFFLGNISNPLHFGQLKNTLLVCLPFYPFYYFAQKGAFKENYLIIFSLIILFNAVIVFFNYNSEMYLMRNTEEFDFVNNTTYKFVFLIPFVFFYKEKKILSLLFLGLLLFFIIAGSKRGAVLSGIVGSLFYILHFLKTIDKKNRIRNYLFTFIGVTAFVVIVYRYFQANELLISRLGDMVEGDSSGRDHIYSTLFNTWYNSENILNLLFGFGYFSSIEISNAMAHNDWLELLSSFGLLGVLVYFFMFSFALRFVFNKKIRKEKRLMMLSVLSIWFLTSIVSMNYASPNGVFQTILLAYLFGETNKHANSHASEI